MLKQTPSWKELRYRQVPQMRDYDTLFEKRWLPYLMYFQPPDRITPSFTTDAYGFRKSVWQGESLSFDAYCAQGGVPRAALVGGSAAFGVGATSDACTLASCLNGSHRLMWFNFAGRAHNSTQEWLVFLLHLPPSVKTVLIFSGVNNLALARLSNTVSSVYNAFYSQSQFERTLGKGELKGIQANMRQWLRACAKRLTPAWWVHPGENGAEQSLEEKYQNILACYERDLRIWAMLREAMGFKLYFVFQPIASWIPRPLAREEKELFHLLDAAQVHWASLVDYLRERSSQYVAQIRRFCASWNIPFLDLNAVETFREPRWFFVDRAHLTDEGYRLAAQEIERVFSL